jgi:hypothetical protein
MNTSLHPSEILDNSLASLANYRKENGTPELFQIQLEAKIAHQKAKEYIDVLEQALTARIEYQYTETSKHSIT